MRTLSFTVAVALVGLVALAGCTAPSAASPAVRSSTAQVVDIDHGRVYLVTDEAAIRIQQPRAAEWAELESAGVALATEITHLSVSSEETGSTFVVVPPDGADARLHLLVDGLLHPIVVSAASADDIAPLAEAPVELLWSLEVGP